MINKKFNFVLSITFTIIIKHVLSELDNSICIISDQGPNHEHNFTQLSNSDLTISDETIKDTIRLRLCSSLNKKCGDKDGYSICMNRDGKDVGIGKYPGELKNVEHSYLFNFTGDICESTKNYSVIILMKCDYTVDDSSKPEILSTGADTCLIHMLWKTKFACVKKFSMNCTVVDKNNNRFDLSSLTTFSDNHVVPLDNQGKLKMILNVCHSIIHEAGANCRIDTGACLVNSSSGNSLYYNYGDVENNNIVIENDIIKVTYKAGDMCDRLATNLSHYQTTISFVCDPAAIVYSEPKLSEAKPCEYHFIWKTAAACPDSTKCRVFNSETKDKFEFNLQELMNKDYIVNSSNNLQYKFRICGPLVDGDCPHGTGICDVKNSTSAGVANYHLMWQRGGPYLRYTNGADCGNGLKRETLIAFVCGAKGSPDTQTILKDEPCSLIINWYTHLACDKEIYCGKDETDLIPLIRSDKNYVINAAGTEYHINICHPVVPTPNLVCPHGSAVCAAVKNSRGQYTKEISLGFPDQSPVPDADQNLVLKYERGSPCAEDPNTNISSSFKFICDFQVDGGLPEYKSYSNCEYIFEWRTNIVCPAVMGKWYPPCTIKDLSHPNELNLFSLYDKPVPRFVTTKENKNYSINICGGKEHCNGSAVCQGSNGYGTFSHVTFDYRNKLIKLHYSNGTKLSNVSYASELSLRCNKSAGIGDPILKMDANCIALFEWQTAMVCPRVIGEVTTYNPVITTKEKSIVDTNDHSSVQISVISATLFVVILVVGMWLFLRNPQRCGRLRSRITAIKSNKNQSRVQYSRVNTTEEARLLLDASDPCNDGGHLDSDDELLGV